MTERPYNVLFLCTGNSARSIIAESLLRKDGAGRFRAFSAGSDPGGEVNPFALTALDNSGYPTDGLRSKSWEEFAAPGAPEMDVIITVCDNAAGQVCPVWPGHPSTVHWGVEDPASIEGTDSEKQAVFCQVLGYLQNRVVQLATLPVEGLDITALKTKLQAIGQDRGASAGAIDTTQAHAAVGKSSGE